MKEHLEKAIAYVKENHGFADEDIRSELQKIDEERRPVGCDYLNRIGDLMDEYTIENGLQEDWWREFKDEEDIFMAITE